MGLAFEPGPLRRTRQTFAQRAGSFPLASFCVCAVVRAVCACAADLGALCLALKEECGHMAARPHAAVHAQAGLDGAVAARVTRVALLHNAHPRPLHLSPSRPTRVRVSLTSFFFLNFDLFFIYLYFI